ncbi:APH family phosphotransferase fused to gluconate kinase family enzyme [Leptonema illini DSM 21528]|uniref:APH family phosphotransferase fused to gluconate kinase family enzyme n=2 Tax=Leptonema illini TaxID=183 RepID=H2CAE3_9LEPT|nr:APH family phosphotransferase fused to gluconate kinase family enzyme [Leptonema illini DSM 21528]
MERQRLLDFLKNPASYKHGPQSVRIIETHISIVALATPSVYKFRKPVNFGWVDFSTLEKRKDDCNREIELNSRLCPEIYMTDSAVPLFEKDGRLNFEEGEIVEYCVAMHEIDSDRFLGNRMLDGGHIDDADFPLTQLVDRLAPFYKEASSLHFDPDTYYQNVRQPMLENLPPYQSYPIEVAVEMLDLLRYFFETSLEKHRRLLMQRMQDGCVGDFHGDLHLQHIVLPSQEHPSLCIFDCIEFNDAFRQIDRAADIAFLCMDLDYRGYRKQSEAFCKAVADALNDNGLIALQPLLRAYRACVRAKVNVLTSTNEELSPEERSACVNTARRYVNLALRYALAGTEKKAIAVVGKVGSGKSAFARFAASCLGVEAQSSDRIRKELSGLPVLQPTPDVMKPLVYDEATSEKTYNTMMELALHDAQTKGIAILDATFSSTQRRAEAIRRFSAGGIELLFVEVSAPDRVRRERLERRRFRPNQSDARTEDLSFLDAKYSAPDELPSNRIVRIDSSKGTKEETGVAAMKQLMDLLF